MKLPLLSLALLALAPAAGAKKTITSPWSIQTAPAAAPDDILGEHQPLERSWTVASTGCGLDTLYLALPGRVFVELDPSALPPPPPVPTEPPVVETEPPVVETEPPVVETEPPVPTETEPPVPTETEPPVPTETEPPLPILPPVVPIEGSGSGSLASGSAGDAVEFPTVQLRRHWEEDEEEEEECPRSRKKSKKDNKHKKHEEEEEEPSSTVYIRVVVTGDSPELLDMIEVVPLHPRRSDAIKLHLANADAQADGYLLTTVYVLNPRSLRSITTAFDGEVVVDDRVLAIADDRDDLVASDDEEDEEDENENAYSRLSLAVVGDANLYVDRPESSLLVGNVSFGSLNVVVTGSGTVQLPFLLGASVSLGKSLDIDVAGSGAVALAAQSVALDSLSASVTGSGVVVVEATGAVTVDSTMELSVFGSGSLSVSTSGTVDKEKLELSGAGQLLAGSIVANTADVSVWGSGLVLVQALEKLTVSTSVWGAVGYVNAKPATVKIDGWWFWRSADEIVYPAAENLVLAPEFSTPPPKYPTYYAVETHFSKRDDDPDYTIVTTDPEDGEESSSSGIVSMAVAAVSTKAEKATGLSATTIAALAVVVVAVVAVAARSFEQFRMRRQYTRLL